MEKRIVLIVDDDELIRKQLAGELERNFFETIPAANAGQAQEIIGKRKVNVLLVDVKLPDMNGLDLLTKIKERQPHIEVIVMTGYGTQEIAIQALRRGAIDYIEKPVNMDELNSALGRAMEKLSAKNGLISEKAVLVIDDEKLTVERLRSFLAKEGYRTFGALRGAEGLDVIRANRIDVVITDIKMPDIGGIEVLKSIKKIYPEIEVIMITGHGEQELAIESLRAGAIDYLQKPVNLDELLCSVNKAVERISLNRINLFRNRELKLSTEIISKMNEELEKKVNERTTKLKETQVQLVQTSKLATLGEMSAGLAHEINQPLSGITLTARNLKKLMDSDSLTREGIKGALEDIDTSINRITKIIGHIRTFARQDSFNFVQVDVREPIKNALSLLGEQLRLHEIEVIEEYSCDLPKVKGEPYQLEQVMINLISNARDAMDEKWKKNAPGHRKKLILKTEKANDEVWIRVTDNGNGMTGEERQRIFEPFFTTKEVGKAMGLGMSISYGIIEAHKGTIEVESEEGKGTTIRVKLPATGGGT